ncbi:hypothetical protein Droror1_Dr00009660 [Drosera rotundifolia]
MTMIRADEVNAKADTALAQAAAATTKLATMETKVDANNASLQRIEAALAELTTTMANLTNCQNQLRDAWHAELPALIRAQVNPRGDGVLHRMLIIHQYPSLPLLQLLLRIVRTLLK